MKNIFTSLALILFCVTFATAQETVTIRLNGSGGYKYIECNGETNTSGKLAVTKGSLVKISTTAGDPDSNKFAFFTISKSYKDGGEIISNKNPYSFIAETNATYYLNYVDINKDLTATVNITSTEGGNATHGKPYGYTFTLGDEIDLRATANDGYEFVNWTDKAGNVISTEARYTGIVTEKEATYTANFASLTNVEAVIENKEECIYDLLGNRISHISKQGIYIVNGKKTLVK